MLEKQFLTVAGQYVVVLQITRDDFKVLSKIVFRIYLYSTFQNKVVFGCCLTEHSKIKWEIFNCMCYKSKYSQCTSHVEHL